MDCIDSERKANEYRETYVGWRLKGRLVHPIYAYARREYWLRGFELTFPEKAEKMKEYSKKRGWGKAMHDFRWNDAVLHWLNKTA